MADRHGTDAMFAAALRRLTCGLPPQRLSNVSLMAGKHGGPLIAPSILAADFARLADEAAAVNGADWLHVDDDGQLNSDHRPRGGGEPAGDTTSRWDCHLMIDNLDWWAPPYAEAGRLQRHLPRVRPPTTRVGVARDIRAAGASRDQRGWGPCWSHTWASQGFIFDTPCSSCR